jgi:Txe/YoeB family toxin of Txe-Axe toxin-antitoxin module
MLNCVKKAILFNPNMKNLKREPYKITALTTEKFQGLDLKMKDFYSRKSSKENLRNLDLWIFPMKPN